MIYEWPQTAEIAKHHKFTPGQTFSPANDFFVREVIQPAVAEHITPCVDWTIQIFTYINVILILEVTQLFMWVGLSDLLVTIWPFPILWARDLSYTLLGFLVYTISVRLFPQDTLDLETDWDIGVPIHFGWGRRTKNFLKYILSFLAYVLIQTGLWDLIELYVVSKSLPNSSAVRSLIFVFIPILVGFFFEEVASPESLYWWAQKFPLHPLCLCCQPNQDLEPANDDWVRETIQPLVKPVVSPFADWVIQIFNYVNIILIITIVQMLQWVGTWDLLSENIIWQDTTMRDEVYCIIGLSFLTISHVFFNVEQVSEQRTDVWTNGIPRTFGWRRKLKAYGRTIFGFIGFSVLWIGAWDAIDTKIFTPNNNARNALYVVLSLAIHFIFAELLSQEALYWIASHLMIDEEERTKVLENYYTEMVDSEFQPLGDGQERSDHGLDLLSSLKSMPINW